MKIGIVTELFPPHISGPGTCAYYLSKKLHEMGHEVTVFTSKKDSSNYKYPFKVHRLKPVLFLFGAPLLVQLPKRIFLSDLDILHIFFPTAFVADFSVFMSKLKKIPCIIYHYNDLYEERLSLRKLLIEFYNLVIFRMILKLADKIIVPVRKNVERSYILFVKDKVSIVPTAVDTNIFYPRKASFFRKKLGLKDELVLIFVSVLNPWHRYKGLDYLLEAISKFDKPVKLIVVGAGKLLNFYKNLARSLGIEKKVIFAGTVLHDLLPLYYSASDVFVLPSLNKLEGFGIVAAEAMASGLPVITTTEAGISELIEKADAGIVVRPRNVRQLVSALNKLYDKKVRKKFRENAVGCVRKELTFDKMSDRLLKVYSEVLK